jgi:glutamate-5-semialdehyde dehydrogenase
MGAMREMAERARAAARALATTPTGAKNDALLRMAGSLRDLAADIMEANANDLEAGADLSSAMKDRLRLDAERIGKMASGLEEVAKIPDPVGLTIGATVRPNGLRIRKVRVPIGVVAIIYESRPNVTADAASLCLKSGNASILRGGKESIHSNRAIGRVLSGALEASGLPKDAIQVVESTDRALVGELLRLDDLVDLVVPRGGKGLIRRVVEESTIPVVKHYEGICHVYVDKDADLDMAHEIAMNAKVRRPGVCNAMETLLVHRDVAAEFLPRVSASLAKAGVELRGCEESLELVPTMKPAKEEDWRTEYLDLILAVRVVGSLEAAMDHIERYGSRHTDSIVTRDEAAAKRFLDGVDSACVFHNASTRFSDGFEFGLGAEIGISTDKLHARGPMGLEELTSYKWIALGDGQVRT